MSRKPGRIIRSVESGSRRLARGGLRILAESGYSMLLFTEFTSPRERELCTAHLAERNILSAFEFAQKIVQATDIQEMVRLQSLFVQSQMQALTEQAKDLGETVSKSAMDSMTGSKKG